MRTLAHLLTARSRARRARNADLVAARVATRDADLAAHAATFTWTAEDDAMLAAYTATGTPRD